MTDTVLALLITALLLIGMALVVPLLVLVERLLTSGKRSVVRQLPEEGELVPEASSQAEAA